MCFSEFQRTSQWHWLASQVLIPPNEELFQEWLVII